MKEWIFGSWILLGRQKGDGRNQSQDPIDSIREEVQRPHFHQDISHPGSRRYLRAKEYIKAITKRASILSPTSPQDSQQNNKKLQPYQKFKSSSFEQKPAREVQQTPELFHRQETLKTEQSDILPERADLILSQPMIWIRRCEENQFYKQTSFVYGERERPSNGWLKFDARIQIHEGEWAYAGAAAHFEG